MVCEKDGHADLGRIAWIRSLLGNVVVGTAYVITSVRTGLRGDSARQDARQMA